MAAIDATRPLGLLTLAALALPGVMPRNVRAEEAPERGTLAVKYLQYADSQSVQTHYPFYTGSEPSTFDRIRVDAPSVLLALPLGRRWLVESSATVDTVSGASPRYYSDVSGASRMEDRRKAYDAKVTRYFERTAFALGASTSKENDYLSKAVSAEGRWSSADNNTTFSAGVGGSNDVITPVHGGVLNLTRATRQTQELMLGVTRAITRNDLAQLTIGGSSGRGDFSDPYKQNDVRPAQRDITTALLRWNHHFDGWNTTLRSSYRYYADSFQVHAHTAELACVMAPPSSSALAFKLTPGVRYYTQSSASFYVDPVTDVAIYPGTLGQAQYSTVDQRLSAFGAVALNFKLEMAWGRWTADLKYERYEQRASWRLNGQGSPGIDPFHARELQLGLALSF